MNIFFETERLILRQFSEDDADKLFELDRDPKVVRFINGGTPTEYEVIQQERLPRILSFYQVYEHYGLWAAPHLRVDTKKIVVPCIANTLIGH